MEKMIDRCRYCENYFHNIERCKYCHYEFSEDKYCQNLKSDDWDIFNLDENEWEHLQILDRLYVKNIECFKADIWYNDEMAYLLGCRASHKDIAKALNIHEDVLYSDGEHDFIIINLFKEKMLRGIDPLG